MIPDPRSSRSVSRSASTRRSTRLDREFPERLLRAIADEYALYLYDVPSLEGSDAYGFVLSREPLDERELPLSANMSETVTPWKFSVEGETGAELHPTDATSTQHRYPRRPSVSFTRLPSAGQPAPRPAPLAGASAPRRCRSHSLASAPSPSCRRSRACPDRRIA